MNSHFDFVWRIENFNMYPSLDGTIRSPLISAGVPHHSVWYLALHLRVLTEAEVSLNYELVLLPGSFEADFTSEVIVVGRKGKNQVLPRNEKTTTNPSSVTIENSYLTFGTLILQCVVDFSDIHSQYASDLKELSETFTKLYESREFSDLELYTSDKEFHVHKFLIGQRAPELCKALKLEFDNTKNERVKVDNISTPVLQVLIKYLYSGKLGSIPEDRIPEFYEVVEKYRIREFGNEAIHLKSHAVIRTHVKADRKNIHWSIETSNDSADKTILKCIDFEPARFLVKIHLTDEGNWMRISIRCASSLDRDILLRLTCDTVLEEKESLTLFYLDKKLRFANGKKEHQFPQQICCRKVPSESNILLKLSFAVSGGELSFSADTTTLKSPEPSPIFGMGLLSNDLTELLLEKSNIDVKLCNENSTFLAHKAVLAAWSPVFSRMFHHDMEEKKRNEVHIPDMDSSNLLELLHFMYSGSLPLHSYGLNMYTAADKYQVTPLFRKCSSFLATTITTDNACDLLVLADLYSDNLLFAAVQEFVGSQHRLRVLGSNEWNSLIETHPGIATKVLKEIAGGLSSSNSRAYIRRAYGRGGAALGRRHYDHTLSDIDTLN